MAAVTPNCTPQRRGSPTGHDDLCMLPTSVAPTATGGRRGPLNASNVSAGDVSISFNDASALHVNWGDTSAVAAASVAKMPQNRSVMPLPTMLEKARADGVMSMSNGMVSIHHAPAAAHQHQGHGGMMNTSSGASYTMPASANQTYSSAAKHSPSRGRVRPGSSSVTSARRGTSASRVRHTSKVSASSSAAVHGVHVNDASCCGYRRAEEHARRPNGGLFVTFCEEGLMQRVDTAMKELEMERDQRENDTHLHKVEMVRMLRRVDSAESERDLYKRKFTELTAEHEKSMSEGRVIRDEFERRWRQSLADREQEAKELEELRLYKSRAEMSTEARQVEIDAAERRNTDMKQSLNLSEKDAAENAKRAQQYFEELSIARKSVAALSKESDDLKELLSARESIIRGMEKELTLANEKLSSIHTLRSAPSTRNRSASTASRAK